ncbi:DUF4349 domain-containing protein [Leucobacter salsicius]|uniref:DUF4349 domain-containing protein n=1 Tax=Leucobacter salsicius TaxID=664638 RepID=UPI0003627CD1|nr:DUF4349 domain-containing protein [Leucobacter salsicius]
MHRISFAPLAVAAALALSLLSGCAAGSGDASGSDGSSSTSTDLGETLDSASSGGAEPFAQEPKPMSPEVTAEQQVVKTGEVTLQANNPESAATEVTKVVQGLGGSVESLSVYQASADAPAGASLTVRIPSAKLDEAFKQFGTAGEIVSQSRSTQDVTTEYVDLEARIKALETSVKRLNDLMSGAATTSELIEAEAALTQRQQELDGLRAQFKALDGQVTEATIWVSITAPSVLPGGGPGTFWEGLIAGFNSLGTAGAGALVVLGIALPWLVIAAAVAAAITAIVRVRRARRARAARPVDQTPAPL